MLRQRVFGPVQGYEDLNDHAALRIDPLMQTACGRDSPLDPAPTLCRLENRASRTAAWAVLALLVKRLRRAWPEVRIILRGDCGFCRHRMLTWCERNALGYCVRLPWPAPSSRAFRRQHCGPGS